VFTRLFEQAEIARFTPDKSRIYEESLKHYRDLRNVISSTERRGREEGREEGRQEGLAEGKEQEKLENARKMKVKGYPADDIAEITGLSPEEIKKL